MGCPRIGKGTACGVHASSVAGARLHGSRRRLGATASHPLLGRAACGTQSAQPPTSPSIAAHAFVSSSISVASSSPEPSASRALN